MEKSEFHYKRKPAIISFLPVYLFCFGISFLLIDNSPAISKEISRQVMARVNMPDLNFIMELPYGFIFAVPFLASGIFRVLWNAMSLYEFNSSEIRLLTGSFIRKERFFVISDFFEISFRQNLLETPFRTGSLSLISMKSGKRLIIKGVYDIRSVVESLRPGLSVSL